MQQIVNGANAQLRQRFGARRSDALEIQHALVHRGHFVGDGLFAGARFRARPRADRRVRRNFCRRIVARRAFERRRGRGGQIGGRDRILCDRILCDRILCDRILCDRILRGAFLRLGAGERNRRTRRGQTLRGRGFGGRVGFGDGRAVERVFEFVEQFAGHAHDVAARFFFFVGIAFPDVVQAVAAVNSQVTGTASSPDAMASSARCVIVI